MLSSPAPPRSPAPADASAPVDDAIRLGADEVRVYYTKTAARQTPEAVAEDRALLSADEAAAQARFYFDRDRHLYGVAHALVRRVLSRHAAVPPRDWQFVARPHGRPEISAPAQCQALRFNLSHTHGLAACAVTRTRDLGVDAEDGHRRAPLDVAPSCFSPVECAALSALPGELQPRRFFTYWTLKEAYIKARGLGMSLPLRSITLHPDAEEGARVELAVELGDDAADWTFARRLVDERFFLAVAVRSGGAPVSITWEELV